MSTTNGNAAADETVTQRQVRWDDSSMTTNFANVVNIQSTREEVDLFFGTNQTWNPADERVLTVQLTNRVILTPLAAKRLWLALGNVLGEIEQRHGPLEVEGAPARDT